MKLGAHWPALAAVVFVACSLPIIVIRGPLTTIQVRRADVECDGVVTDAGPIVCCRDGDAAAPVAVPWVEDRPAPIFP